MTAVAPLPQHDRRVRLAYKGHVAGEQARRSPDPDVTAKRVIALLSQRMLRRLKDYDGMSASPLAGEYEIRLEVVPLTPYAPRSGDNTHRPPNYLPDTRTARYGPPRANQHHTKETQQ